MKKFITSMLLIAFGILIGISMVRVIVVRDDGTVCAEIK